MLQCKGVQSRNLYFFCICKMSTIVLYLLCACLLLHPCLGLEVFFTSYEARVRKGRASASCQFELRYSDEGVQQAAVNCTRVTKVGLLNADICTVLKYTTNTSNNTLLRCRSSWTSFPLSYGNNFIICISIYS